MMCNMYGGVEFVLSVCVRVCVCVVNVQTSWQASTSAVADAGFVKEGFQIYTLQNFANNHDHFFVRKAAHIAIGKFQIIC